MTSEVSIFSLSNWNSMYLMFSGMIITAIIGYLTLRINIIRKHKEEEAILNGLKTIIDTVVAEVYETKTVIMKQEAPEGKLSPEQIAEINTTCLDLVKVRINKADEEEYLKYIADINKFIDIEVPMSYARLKARKEAEARLNQIK